jgi:hypothetical protein
MGHKLRGAIGFFLEIVTLLNIEVSHWLVL